MLNILFLIPKNILSRFIGYVVSIEKPAFIIKFFIKLFVRVYNINLEEASKNLSQYSSIANLFIRDLKSEMRPVKGDVVSPVDGILRDISRINLGTLIQVKGKTYSVKDLLNDDTEDFDQGFSANIYLTPRHYHHIHSPIAGKVISINHIPGKLWPVNDWSLNKIDQLFCINERVVVFIESSIGKVAVVMVGATNVGKITSPLEPALSTNLSAVRKPRSWNYEKLIEITAGQRIGTFHMGSSVVVLFQNSNLKPVASIKDDLKYGEVLFEV